MEKVPEIKTESFQKTPQEPEVQTWEDEGGSVKVEENNEDLVKKPYKKFNWNNRRGY